MMNGICAKPSAQTAWAIFWFSAIAFDEGNVTEEMHAALYDLSSSELSFGGEFRQQIFATQTLIQTSQFGKKLELSAGSSAGWESNCVGRGIWCRDRDVPNVQSISPVKFYPTANFSPSGFWIFQGEPT